MAINEFFTEAIVLDKENSGETNSRISLYTKASGKITATAKGARKITSKLSAHLEPLNLIETRLIFGKTCQIADALRLERATDPRFLDILKLVNQINAEGQPDSILWRLLRRQYRQPRPIFELTRMILKISGFDPQFAVCQYCQEIKPAYFLIADTQYLCQSCLVNYNYKNIDVCSI